MSTTWFPGPRSAHRSPTSSSRQRFRRSRPPCRSPESFKVYRSAWLLLCACAEAPTTPILPRTAKQRDAVDDRGSAVEPHEQQAFSTAFFFKRAHLLSAHYRKKHYMRRHSGPLQPPAAYCPGMEIWAGWHRAAGARISVWVGSYSDPRLDQLVKGGFDRLKKVCCSSNFAAMNRSFGPTGSVRAEHFRLRTRSG